MHCFRGIFKVGGRYEYVLIQVRQNVDPVVICKRVLGHAKRVQAEFQSVAEIPFVEYKTCVGL